jgi:predicted O-methyltransferase YrrM
MRGPLLSGAIGNPATLGRVCSLVREQGPVVVLSALWLAEALAEELPVLALVEEDKRNAAARALRRARKMVHSLSVVVAAAEVPLARGSVGTVLVESLVDIEDQQAASDLLVGLLPSLKPGGLIVSLDATKSPALEARVSELFLAASLAHIEQTRPREGALMTTARVPHPIVVDTRFGLLLGGEP